MNRHFKVPSCEPLLFQGVKHDGLGRQLAPTLAGQAGFPQVRVATTTHFKIAGCFACRVVGPSRTSSPTSGREAYAQRISLSVGKPPHMRMVHSAMQVIGGLKPGANLLASSGASFSLTEELLVVGATLMWSRLQWASLAVAHTKPPSPPRSDEAECHAL